MWILLLIAMALSCAGLIALFRPHRGPEYAIIELILGACFFVLWRHIGRHQGQAEEFRDWLIESQLAVRAGNAVYGSIPITRETESEPASRLAEG